MAAESGAEFDAKIKAAHDTIAAFESRIGMISNAISRFIDFDFYDGSQSTLDFRKLLKKYAHSGKLDPMLLESQRLYKAMIPHMIRSILDFNFHDDHFTDQMPRHLREEIAGASDERWVQVVANHGGYKFPTYTWAEFVKVAQEKGESAAEVETVSDSEGDSD
jgi:hypothetical protein